MCRLHQHAASQQDADRSGVSVRHNNIRDTVAVQVADSEPADPDRVRNGRQVCGTECAITNAQQNTDGLIVIARDDIQDPVPVDVRQSNTRWTGSEGERHCRLKASGTDTEQNADALVQTVCGHNVEMAITVNVSHIERDRVVSDSNHRGALESPVTVTEQHADVVASEI